MDIKLKTMNLFKYIYYKSHQLNLTNNNFGDGKFGSLLAGTFTISVSLIVILIGMDEYIRFFFDINLFYLHDVIGKYGNVAFEIVFIACPIWLYFRKNGEEIIQEYDRRSLTSKFYNLSPYWAIGVLYFIVCAWLTSAVFLMSVVNSK